MKKKRVWMLMVFVFILGCAQGMAEEIESLVAQYAPQPWCGVSYQESAPFDAITLSPETFIENIAAAENSEDVADYFQRIGLPADDSGYVYSYKHSLHCEHFAPKSNLSGIERIAVVSCTYDPSSNDNMVFLFIKNADSYFLTDVIGSFGDIQLVQDQDNIWLVGRTGTEFQTVRWYHVDRQKVVLSYLAQGFTADRTDYHFYVKSCVDPSLNQDFLDQHTLLILKQTSIDDFTQAGFADTGIMSVLYTEALTYHVQSDGTFLLTDTRKYNEQDIESVKKLRSTLVGNSYGRVRSS